MSDTPTTQYDFRGASFTGGNFDFSRNFAETINRTNILIQAAPAANGLKEALENLQKPIIEAAKQLPPDEGAALLKRYERFTEEATAPKPDKDAVEGLGKSIATAVAKVAEFATPVVPLVAAVMRAAGLAV
jgi:hypothetical protein